MPTRTQVTSAPVSQLPAPPKLMLIDGHSIAYRAFFALPVENFSTQTGQHTNGVFGFTSMLINVLRDEKPTHLAVAFDVSRQTFRSEIYSEYKANRSTTPDEFRGQLDLVKEDSELDIGVSRALVVDLPPGHYVLYCNLEGHYLGGMHASLVVT